MHASFFSFGNGYEGLIYSCVKHHFFLSILYCSIFYRSFQQVRNRTAVSRFGKIFFCSFYCTPALVPRPRFLLFLLSPFPFRFSLLFTVRSAGFLFSSCSIGARSFFFSADYKSNPLFSLIIFRLVSVVTLADEQCLILWWLSLNWMVFNMGQTS